MNRLLSMPSLARAPVVRNVLIALLVSYLLFALSSQSGFLFTFFSALELRPSLVLTKGYIWQLVTYAFLHDVASPFHLLMNGLIFYFIGPEMENRWGSKRFIRFIVATIVGGAIFVCISYLVGLSTGPVIGFSAVGLGLIVAWGITYKERVMHIFGIIPVTGRSLVWWTLLLEVLYAFSASRISSAAHFGGMAASAILTLGLWRPERLQNYLKQLRFRFKHKYWK